MKTVSQMLKVIDRPLVSANPDDFVYDALNLMAKHDIGCVLVNDDEQLVGLISERDYARNVTLKGRNSWKTPIKLIMRTEFPAVSQDTSIDVCMTLLTEHCLRYLPVIDGNKAIGLISVHDVFRQIMSAQADKIDMLESYVYKGR